MGYFSREDLVHVVLEACSASISRVAAAILMSHQVSHAGRQRGSEPLAPRSVH